MVLYAIHRISEVIKEGKKLGLFFSKAAQRQKRDSAERTTKNSESD